MKKKSIIIIVVVVILAIIGILKLNFSGPNGGNSDPNIIIGAKADKEKAIKVTFTIDATVLTKKENYDKLGSEYQSYVPKDGYIIKNLDVQLTKEYTVEQVLQAIAKEKNITIEYASMSDMTYIEAINNLGSKAVGDMSGWLYMINGEFPMTSIDKTILKDGDKVTFIYSADGGSDIKGLK